MSARGREPSGGVGEPMMQERGRQQEEALEKVGGTRGRSRGGCWSRRAGGRGCSQVSREFTPPPHARLSIVCFPSRF